MRGVAAAALVALLATGCSSYNDKRGKGDAPVGEFNDDARAVWNGPDSFMNIAAWCIGADGVYAHTREAAPVILANDPNCAEGGVLAGP